MYPLMYSDSATRIVWDGEMPSEAAAAMSAVVLKGVGGWTVRRERLTLVTLADDAPATASTTARAAASSLNRSTAWPALNSLPPLSKAPRTTQ